MIVIDYLLLTGLIAVLLVAGYAAVIRRLQAPLRTNRDESFSNAAPITPRAISSLAGGRRMDAGVVGRRSRNRLIGAARLSSFARKPISRRRHRGA